MAREAEVKEVPPHVQAEADALTDAEYHRSLCFGRVDDVRQTQLGRELLPHEAQSRIPYPQLEIIERAERAIADREGEVIVIRLSRQSGKNETEAHLEARALSIWKQIPGSTWIRTAPTWKPQIVNSMLRLDKFLKADPFLKHAEKRHGFIVENGHAQIQYLSGGATANVLGATASICLSVDEAHKIDADKFEREFLPFTASTNAPTLMYGVAADKLDLLYEYRQLAEGTDRLLEYPAEIWCELSPAYAAHYESRVRKLGESHPIIMTEYRLKDIDAVGGYLNPAQRASLFGGDHPRMEAPRAGMLYALVVDIGGESELEADDETVRQLEAERDSSFGFILEWDPKAPLKPYPEIRIVNGFWLTGRPHLPSASAPARSSLLETILALHKVFRFRSGVIDARGVGEAVAAAVSREIPAVKPYKASLPDVSTDCYDLQARLNTGLVKVWRADPAADPELRELHAQARHTKYEIVNHDQMRLTKPTGVDSSRRHIDGIKALTYIHRAIKAPGSGLLDYFAQEHERREKEASK